MIRWSTTKTGVPCPHSQAFKESGPGDYCVRMRELMLTITEHVRGRSMQIYAKAFRELWLVSTATYASGQLLKYAVPRSSAEHHQTTWQEAECVAGTNRAGFLACT